MSDLNKIVDQLSKLTVVEAAELSKQLEDKWCRDKFIKVYFSISNIIN